ncbi:MAG: hypothetical protein QW051_04070 [Candidatus Aenigmatarchaeota archaeon]
MQNKNNGNNGRKDVIEKVKRIVNGFYDENQRGLNVVFDGLNSLIRAWGYEPREIIQELQREGYRIVPGRSRNGIPYIKVFPPHAIFNKSSRELEKYLK